MITKAGSPGGGQCIAPRLAEACDSPKRGELGRAIFDSGGLRSRYPLTIEGNDEWIPELSHTSLVLQHLCRETDG